MVRLHDFFFFRQLLEHIIQGVWIHYRAQDALKSHSVLNPVLMFIRMRVFARWMNGLCHTHSHSSFLRVFAIRGLVCFPILSRSCSGRTTLARRVQCTSAACCQADTCTAWYLASVFYSSISFLRLSSSCSSLQLEPIDTSFCNADVIPLGTEKAPVLMIGLWRFHCCKKGSCTGLATFSTFSPVKLLIMLQMRHTLFCRHSYISESVVFSLFIVRTCQLFL